MVKLLAHSLSYPAPRIATAIRVQLVPAEATLLLPTMAPIESAVGFTENQLFASMSPKPMSVSNARAFADWFSYPVSRLAKADMARDRDIVARCSLYT